MCRVGFKAIPLSLAILGLRLSGSRGEGLVCVKLAHLLIGIMRFRVWGGDLVCVKLAHLLIGIIDNLGRVLSDDARPNQTYFGGVIIHTV